MDRDAIVETIYGRHNKFEIVRSSGIFTTSYHIYRDGRHWKGSYSTLKAAVEAAQAAG